MSAALPRLLDAERREPLVEEQPVSFGGRATDVLIALIEARETVASKVFGRGRATTHTIFRCGHLPGA